MVSIDDIQEVVHGHFKQPIIGPLKSKMAEFRHLENRQYVIFSAVCGPIWIKFRRLVQNDMSTVVICSKSNSMACHPTATCHIAGGATWRMNVMIPEPGLGKNGPGKNGPGKNGPEKTVRGITGLVVESVKTVRSFR